MTLGDRIKQAREARGLTMLQLAERVGVREATVSRYESGGIKNLPQSRLVAIAKALGVDSNYLMDWNGPSLGTNGNGELTALREEMRRGAGIMFDAAKGATEEEYIQYANLIKALRKDHFEDE